MPGTTGATLCRFFRANAGPSEGTIYREEIRVLGRIDPRIEFRDIAPRGPLRLPAGSRAAAKPPTPSVSPRAGGERPAVAVAVLDEGAAAMAPLDAVRTALVLLDLRVAR